MSQENFSPPNCVQLGGVRITIELWNYEINKLQDLVNTSQDLAKALFGLIHENSSLNPDQQRKLRDKWIFPNGTMTHAMIHALLAKETSNNIIHLHPYSFSGQGRIQKVLVQKD